jgi:hypothetical protein
VVNRKDDADEAEKDFIDELEQGVRSVLKKKGSTAAERLNAVQAGIKLLAVRHKIEGDETDNFFTK